MVGLPEFLPILSYFVYLVTSALTFQIISPSVTFSFHPPAAFAGLLHLRELDLSNNSLHYFKYGVLEDLYYLRTLSLGGNPWICDYNIHYLIYWLKHHPAVEHTGLVCSEPEEFRGWLVESYVKTYNAECPKDKQVDLHRRADPTDATSKELIEKIEEDPELLPRPLRKKEPNKFEIFRLS